MVSIVICVFFFKKKSWSSCFPFLFAGAAREAELRRLRKMNTEFEEQNAILQKHTESMSCAKERLEQELALEERQTVALQQQLQTVRQALTASFASLPIPGTGEL